MALEAKIRGQWRVVSKAMARVFRARGVLVRDTAALKDLPIRASFVIPTTEKAPPLPAAPVLAQPKAISFDTLTDSIAPPKVASQPVDAHAYLSQLADSGAVAERDLTDEELERLTAPDKAGGE